MPLRRSETIVGSYGSFFVIQDVDNEIEYAEKAHAADFETAIHYARTGKFQRILLAISGIIYATCAISTTTLSFVLPSAECDFHLTSTDKGKLSAVPLVGMIFGCSIWGSLANSRGRKLAIILSLSIDCLASITSAFAQSFQLFLICRFFNGFGIIGATSIIFSYLGEFMAHKKRDVMLGRLEVFWNVGVIFLPGVAWLILKKIPVQEFQGYGSFSPWRIFVLVCGMPSLISLILLCFLPETPKFLISKGKFDEAKNVFQKVFACNTGRSKLHYPILTLEGEYENNNNAEKRKKMSLRKKLKGKLQNILEVSKVLFSQPYSKYLFIAAFVDFGLMASYYTLIMWFPEIFERFNTYEQTHPNSSASVCLVSQSRPQEDTTINFTCNMADRSFIDTTIIGLSCIPTSVSLSYFMKKLGKKCVLICSLVLAGLATLSLNWVQSSSQTLVLSCFFEALTSILETVLFCVVVDLFPTNLRAIALAITATFGRLGAIFGNVLFGLLIDLNCIVPIYLFGSLLIGSGMICIGIPQSDSYIVLH